MRLNKIYIDFSMCIFVNLSY